MTSHVNFYGARRWLLWVSYLLSTGCGQVKEDAFESARASAAVIAGNESTSARDAVVFLRLQQPSGAWNDCTGTLVSPRIVLTAKHCVAPAQAGSFVCRGNGDLVQDGSGAGVFGATAEPDRITVHVGVVPGNSPSASAAKILTSGSPDACRDDFAILILDRPIETIGYPAIRLEQSTVPGESVMLLGYGIGEHPGPTMRRELSGVRIVDVGASEPSANADQATTPARTFTLPGSTVCFGDSGGPALSTQSGALLGVYSRITGDCFAVESRNTFTSVSGFTDLVEQASAEAGETPAVEPSGPPGAQSDAGAAGGAAEPAREKDVRNASTFRCSARPGSSRRGGAASAFALAWLWLRIRLGRRRVFSAGPLDSARDA